MNPLKWLLILMLSLVFANPGLSDQSQEVDPVTGGEKVSGGKPADTARLEREFHKIKNSEKSFKIQLKTTDGKAIYRVGDPVEFQVKVDRNCHLMIFNVRENGESMGTLFPNKAHKSTKIEKNKTYTIPDKNSPYLFRIKGPVGKEYVKAIATLKPINTGSGLTPVSGEDQVDQALNQIRQALNKESAVNWTEKTISFLVEGRQD